MEEAGFEEMVAYVLKRQNEFAYYIATRPIADLCEGGSAEVLGIGF